MNTIDSGSLDLAPIDLVRLGLKGLAGEYAGPLSRDLLSERTVELQDLRQQFDGIIAINMSEADRAGVAAMGGARTMAQYLASRTNISPEAARADLRVGRFASTFERIEEALLDGRMSRQHAEVVRKLENIRVTYALLRDQHLFVQWAQDFDWAEFKRLCKYWLDVNDQDGAEPEDHDPLNTVTFRTDSATGRVKGNFDLDPVAGATLIEQLGQEENALFHEDHEHGYPRKVSQRRAQAFANLIQRGAGRGESSAKPLIHVVMSLKVLQNAIAQMAKDPEEQDFTSMLDANDIDGRCELIDGTPIHPKYALVLMMQARVRRQVLGAKNVTLDASYETRLFPDWMKYIRLLETRGQCTVPGCDAPHTWLQADHRQPSSKVGQTTLSNLDPMCAADNKWKSDRDPFDS